MIPVRASSTLLCVCFCLSSASNVDRFRLRSKASMALHVDAGSSTPRKGQAVTLTPSKQKYRDECAKEGLMDMFNAGVKGTVLEVDENGEGSVMMRSSKGEEAWVPIKALVGFENWVRGAAPSPAAPGLPGGVQKEEMVFSKGSFGKKNLGKEAFNKLFGKGSIIRRECADCTASHKKIYYLRLTDVPAGLSAYDLFLDHWVDKFNKLNVDFRLYGSMEDLKADKDKWTYCNYNDKGVGFPRDCGPASYTPSQWNALSRGQANVRFTVEPAVNGIIGPEETVYMKGSFGSKDIGKEAFDRKFKKGSIVYRHCKACRESHKHIYYLRIADVPAGLSAYNTFLDSWFDKDNKLNVDFRLYSSLEDLKADKKRWSFCNFNDQGVGFPRDCAPDKYVPSQWNSLNRHGQPDIKFTIKSPLRPPQPPPVMDVWAESPPVDSRPTDFVYSSCLKVHNIEDGHPSSSMVPRTCFMHCAEENGAKYFGITKGGVCFCWDQKHGEEVSGKQCNAKCSGNLRETCGGDETASVFTMIDCKKTPELHLASARARKLASLYESREGESCGQAKNNLCELNGSSRMLGTIDECKLACWDGKGADGCDGFTYNKVLKRCTFYKDVLDGETRKKDGLQCFFKKIGYPMA